MSVSVVVPIYNEHDNIEPLYESLHGVLSGLACAYEMIFVDDGSTDGSGQRLRQLAERDPRVKVVELRRNFGQTAAMHVGIQHASGEVVVTMDGDLQNDPADIPMMLAKLDEGYDLVHGWRKNRQDALVSRKLPSRIANWLISKVTGFAVHDLGCTLKAMRREIAQELQLYGEMHRFIPILAHWQGARCAEVVTRHHARRFGTTKYGIWRTFRVVLDLITVKFMIRFSASPMKLFGGVGLVCSFGSVLAGLATVLMKLARGIDMTGNPLLLLSVFAATVGVQFFVLGLLGEVCARIYYECQNKQPYTIRRLINFDASPMSHDDDVPDSRAA
jgi:glycosyltransferase involved in cell wall biosynthesis